MDRLLLYKYKLLQVQVKATICFIIKKLMDVSFNLHNLHINSLSTYICQLTKRNCIHIVNFFILVICCFFPVVYLTLTFCEKLVKKILDFAQFLSIKSDVSSEEAPKIRVEILYMFKQFFLSFSCVHNFYLSTSFLKVSSWVSLSQIY